MDFPGGSEGKASTFSAGDPGSGDDDNLKVLPSHHMDSFKTNVF